MRGRPPVSGHTMNDDSTRLRFRLVGIIAVSLFVAMFARLWFVQVVDAESYQEEASANIFRHVATPAPRGHILDANEKVIVDNRLSNVLVVDRQAFARATVEASDAPPTPSRTSGSTSSKNVSISVPSSCGLVISGPFGVWSDR